MIKLRMTDRIEDIRQWTGLPADDHDRALWEAGFNLDDWDVCFESNKRLVDRVSDGRGEWWDEPIAEAWWLVNRMDGYCCGYNEVEYNGKWYYTIHHS